MTATIDTDSTLDLSFAASASGIATLVIRATDGGGLVVEDTLVVTVRVPLVVSSAANQSFVVGNASTTAGTITIIDETPNATITDAADIRIRIPAGFNMIWDSTVTSVTIGGGALAKVSGTLLSYEDGYTTAVINVTTDFAASDTITVAGLKFENFTAASTADNLELEVNNDGQVSATDDKTITIVAVTYAVAVTPDTTTASNLPSNGTNYTVDFTVTNNGNDVDDFDLLTTQSPGTAVSVVSITGTGVTQGANPDSARVANLAISGSVVVTVTYAVADVAAGAERCVEPVSVTVLVRLVE